MSTMRHLVFASAGSAILAISGVPAHAATEKIPYQQSILSGNCDSGLYCEVNFPATTAQTAIHSVSCWSVVSSGAVVQQLSLSFTNANGQQAVIELPIFSGGPNGPGLTTGSNMQTLLFVDNGVAPLIFFQLDSGSISYLRCAISGWTLVP